VTEAAVRVPTFVHRKSQTGEAVVVVLELQGLPRLWHRLVPPVA